MALSTFTAQISQCIVLALAEYATQVSSVIERELLQSVEQFVISGKLMRGNLVVQSAQALGFTGDEAVLLQVAAGIELAGSGILILDDVIDQDAMRRGGPSIHAHWTNVAKERNWIQPQHSGESLALCMDLVLIQIGMQLLSASPVPVAVQGQLSQLSSDLLIKLGLAEAHELQLSLDSSLPPVSEIEQLYIEKTSNYTVVWPLMLGGVLAGIKPGVMEELKQIGQQIGLLFQLRDDWLNLYGDPAVTGKSTLSDITNRKKTWALAQLLDSADVSDRAAVVKFMQAKTVQPDQVQLMIDLFSAKGFRTYLDKQTQSREAQVKKSIAQADVPTATTEFLLQVLEFVTTRVK